MSKIKSLLLVWKNYKNDLYYHIGTLSFNGEVYTFEYSFNSDSTRNVKSAIDNGYTGHPAFPSLDKVYTSDHLFEAFNRRIPDQSRIGYENFLSDLNLTNQADRMDILQATRGALANDPYTFEQPLKLNDETLSATFFINGMRHREFNDQEWLNEIDSGDRLHMEIEPDNFADPYAVKILSSNQVHLGYVPGIYNQALFALLKRDVPLKLLVRKIRLDFSPQWWVEVDFEAKVNINDTDLLIKSNLNHLLHKESA
ncbi:hypothetical protein JMA_35430 [Jeotgalibacillus malaysiensis]|uniref:HIRAN domain-containing protein n=1 Tax=Jeotgalibacillus malaysiensis TaxID=1508404 RepID=A0A0B5ARI5_9BACL|nr:HIRAN domain-containing protein [Jeotgalibacillus malaysiensis]AJD92860.1 hypothetical protein JMA_35430 [Jeotgalibacillus malaysiensis]